MAAATHFEVIEIPHGLRLVGELDMLTAPELEAALVQADNGRVVTLDLAELTFIDSSGIHLIAEYAESMDVHLPVRLANVPRQIAQVFRVTRLHKHSQLEIEPAE